MEIQSLRYVVTLAEELHFGRAAKRRFISAQPFGQAVQRLEREVGVRLFERTSRRVNLTSAGARFVGRARLVLAELEGLRQIAAEEAGAGAGSLRVGILGFGAADRWQALRDAVDVQQPGLSLQYCDLDLTDQYDAVRRGEVDVAVVQFVGQLDGVDFAPVLSSPRVAVVPAWSELAGASFLTLGDLAELPWLEVGGTEPLLASWVGSARHAGALCVRHPAAIPAAVATTGRVSLHAAAAARYYPRQLRQGLGFKRWADTEAINLAGADPDRVSTTALEALRWSTVNAAEALGLGHQIGSLTVGKQDDLMIVGGPGTSQHPIIDAAGTLIFQATASDVRTVLVAGRAVKRDGVMTGVNLSGLLSKAETSAEEILARVRAAVPVLPPVPPGGFAVIRDMASANLSA